MPAHETLHPPAADQAALGPQSGMHAWGTVAPMVCGMDELTPQTGDLGSLIGRGRARAW